MDKPLSDKDRKMLLNALEKAKEASRAMQAKEEEKRWAPIEVPLTLDEAFAGLTKDELSKIRVNWDVSGASALKKQDLIAALKRQLPDVLPDLLNRLDETRCKIMRQAADRGGHAFVRLEALQLDYFKSRGLLFSGTYKGKQTLAMPQEVLACFEQVQSSAYRETIRRNTEWIKLSQGLLFYIGTLNNTELYRQVKSYTNADLAMFDYLRLLEEAESFYRLIRHDSAGVSNIHVIDPMRVKQEHASRPDIPFYPFTKAQLLLAGEPDFVDRNPSHRAFVDFIVDNYNVSREDADNLVKDCVFAIRIGESPGDVLGLLQKTLEMADLETMDAFMAHIAALHNNTRQWFIKGYSPNVLSAAKNKSTVAPWPAAKATVIDFATRKTVGRNDPCPCGSGKKFKKCCGHSG